MPKTGRFLITFGAVYGSPPRRRTQMPWHMSSFSQRAELDEPILPLLDFHGEQNHLGTRGVLLLATMLQLQAIFNYPPVVRGQATLKDQGSGSCRVNAMHARGHLPIHVKTRPSELRPDGGKPLPNTGRASGSGAHATTPRTQDQTHRRRRKTLWPACSGCVLCIARRWAMPPVRTLLVSSRLNILIVNMDPAPVTAGFS